MRHNINKVTQLIRDRRTIYPEQFTGEGIEKEEIELLLNNAIWAPTHGKTEPWRFKVFTGQSLSQLAEFQSSLYKELTATNAYKEVKFEKLKNRPLKSAAVIAVCMQRQDTERIPEIEEIEAVACAVHNMHLTCTALGVGGFWATPKFIYTSHMNKFLDLSDKDKCLGLFYVGVPAIEWPTQERKSIAEVVTWM